MTMTKTEGRDRGKKRAECGLKRAAYLHESEIRRDVLRLLDALLASDDGTATTDDAVDDLSGKYSDGGQWRGNIPKRLLAAGVIAFDGWSASARPSRHGGPVKRWRLLDRDAAMRYRAELLATPHTQPTESATADSSAV